MQTQSRKPHHSVTQKPLHTYGRTSKRRTATQKTITALDGDAVLDAEIRRLRSLRTFEEEVAIAAASKVAIVAQRSAAAGTTPNGEVWTPKKTGGRPLLNAASAITARAVGAVVQIVLSGVEVFHNRGVGKTTPKRPILPDSEVPPAMKQAISAAASEVFKRRMQS